MELKKVWMSLDTEKKSHYGYRTVGGILGIVFLMTVLLFIGTFLSISLGLPQQSYSMVLVLMAAAFGIVMAVRMGQRGMQDAVIFFLTENDRLWIMDARGLSYHGRGFWGFALGAMETQKFLRMQGKSPYLPAGASEILKVWNIKENRSHYAIRCQSRYRNHRAIKHTYFLVKGIKDEEMLLKELERRKTWENTLQPSENRNPLYILLSGLALVACVTLCVLSHSAVGIISGEFYFPCLGASLVSFYFLFYFIVRQRRGE